MTLDELLQAQVMTLTPQPQVGGGGMGAGRPPVLVQSGQLPVPQGGSTAVIRRPVNPVATIPRGGSVVVAEPSAVSGGGGARAAGGAGRAAAQSAKGATRFLGPAAGLAIGAYLANGVGDLVDDINDPDSALQRRIAAAKNNAVLMQQRGASAPMQIGSKVGDAVKVVAEGAKSVLYPRDTMQFLQGLFGVVPDENLPRLPKATLVKPEAPVAAAAAPAGQARAAGPTLSFNQLIPLLQAAPRQTGRAPRWEDMVGGQLSEMFQMQQEAILASDATPERKSQALDQLQQQLMSALAKNSLPLMPDDQE